MKKLLKGCMLLGALALLPSCANEEGFSHSGTEGKLTLDLTSDGRVLMSTRADDTKVSVVPDPSQFAISLEKQDGSLSKKWVNVDAFNRETGFPIGTYTLSANYGDVENEGFELPCFSASQEVSVEAGQESHIALTATLSNAMVSVRYKDEFKNQFAAYSASLKSATGANWVAFAQNEDRPAFMKAEALELRLSMTNSQGKEVTVAPYSFTARPQYHYIVTIGVNNANGTGDMSLDVQITEDVESEFVEISLGDDLFNAPAPSLKAYDFPADMSYNELEGFIAAGDPRVDVLAYGGLRKVNLSVESSNTLKFGKSVQLVGADAATQADVAAAGLVAEGFFRNPDKAGVIKFKNFLSQLPPGTYKVMVDVEDNRTLVSQEKIEFNVTVNAVDTKAAVEKAPEFMGREMTVKVTTNNPDLKDAIRFRVANDQGDWVASDILEAPKALRTRASGENEYLYRISTPALKRDQIRVDVLFGNDNKVLASIDEKGVVFPEYSVEVDAFARKVWFKITATDPAKQELVFDNFIPVKGNQRVDNNLSVVSKEEGIYELPVAASATSYNDYASCLGDFSNPSQAIAAFTTEVEAAVTNCDFGASTKTIDFKNIQVGGIWKVALTEYKSTTSIEYSTPNNWANVNDLTCWSGASNKNTWFIVPSTFDNNGEVVLRSVGYHHNGKTPATTSAKKNHYYCSNTPTDGELEKAAGELFLGSYSFDGAEHRINGIEWSSRPESVSFTYTYEPYNSEQGEAYIKIYDKEGGLLSSKNLLISSGKKNTVEVVLPQYPFGKKAAKMELGFRSTREGVTPSVHIPQGDEMNEGFTTSNFITSGQKVATNSYHSLAIGSKLTVDNVKLNYGGSSDKAKRRVAVKKTK